MSVRNIFADESHDIYTVRTHADGPDGELPLTAEMLINRPSGDLFGMTMNAGMGWSPDELDRDGILLLSTLGGLRGADGKPVALALHQGHYELDIQMKAAAEVIKANHALPYAVYVSDPCDGRTQGTTGMFDSLPYRNDASMVMRRLIRSLPDAKAVIGVASCDKGLPHHDGTRRAAQHRNRAGPRRRDAARKGWRRQRQGANHWRTLRQWRIISTGRTPCGL